MNYLTDTERQAVRRAEQLLERTHYDETERVADARICAHNVIEFGQTIEAERSARVAQQRRTAPTALDHEARGGRSDP